MTRVCVIGLGYVGTVVAGCLAAMGHRVMGVEKDRQRADDLREGRLAAAEPGLGDLWARALAGGALTVEDSIGYAVERCDVVMLCVGTPAVAGGGFDYGDLRAGCEEVGRALANQAERRLVVVRSTVTPGTTRGVVVPAVERAAGKRAGDGFGVIYNPEFLREGYAVGDFMRPPFVVIGGDDAQDRAQLRELYVGVDGPLVETAVETAELVKLVSNVWHALKVTFANEMGRMSRSLGVNGQELMEIFCRDERLNISAAYLQPGFAFGGPCLPKDVRALMGLGAQRGLMLPLLEAVLPSNDVHVERAAQIIKQTRTERIGVIGLAHNQHTGDLRDSPALRLIGCLTNGELRRRVRAFDESVPVAPVRDEAQVEVVGCIEDVVRWCEVLVVTTKVDYGQLRLRPGLLVVDLTRGDEGAFLQMGVA